MLPRADLQPVTPEARQRRASHVFSRSSARPSLGRGPEWIRRQRHQSRNADRAASQQTRAAGRKL